MAPTTLLTPFYPAHSFLPSLYTFPASLPPSLVNPAQLQQWSLSSTTDPLHPALLFCAGLSALVWVLGEVTGNVSQVDRLWAILPLLYSAWFTTWPKITGAAGGELSERMLLVLGLQVLWSLRLNTNTYRRGFFNPNSEDYRWEIVRAKIPVWLFKLLNLVFISIIQNVLLLAVELPQYLLLTLHLSSGFPNPGLNLADYALAAVFVLILAVEMLADNQQQRYQALKRRAVDKGVKGAKLSEKEQAAVARGFVTGGLWSWSRHPNFACEQSTWYILYLFTLLPFAYASFFSHSHQPLSHLPSVSLKHLSALPHTLSSTLTRLPYLPTSMDEFTTLLPSRATLLALGKEAYSTLRADEGTWWNYSIWAPLSMSALFYASTDLTERISQGKYPLYKAYQSRVAMFWPPLTVVKGLWLAITLRRGRVERKVWGVGGKGGKEKML